MSTYSEILAQAKNLAAGSHQAILSTADAMGRPHATWMSTLVDEDLSEVLSITSPDSLKVANLRENQQGEWLFASSDREVLLYLSGPTEVVEDVAEIKRCWDKIPTKQHAFFLNYYNSGIGFAVIRTRVESAILCIPREFRKESLRPTPPGAGD